MSDGIRTQDADAGWWERSLSRRDAHKLGIGVAALAALAGCSSEEVKELDALEAQKQGGWDVGDTNDQLVFIGATTQDSKRSDGWKAYLQPAKMLEAIRPKNSAYAAWQMPTLFQALEQPTLASQMRPVATEETIDVHGRARALGSLVTSVEDPKETLLVIDVPGPYASAAAAGLAAFAEPVFYYDNWPHPKGVVPSHITLGAALFYAQELEEKKKERDESKAPAALILDSFRIQEDPNQDLFFDNRYFVTLPSADDLKKAGIKRVVYVPLNETANESDDLNDAMVEYEEAGLAITQVPLASFERDPDAEVAEDDPTGGYYYGGSQRHHTYFYTHYPLFIWFPIPSYGWSRATSAPPRTRPPSYKPRARPTMFSSRTTGAGRGVGRTKPTGFGRVSTRMDKSGRILGTRSGSTGRYRSGGGGYSG